MSEPDGSADVDHEVASELADVGFPACEPPGSPAAQGRFRIVPDGPRSDELPETRHLDRIESVQLAPRIGNEREGREITRQLAQQLGRLQRDRDHLRLPALRKESPLLQLQQMISSRDSEEMAQEDQGSGSMQAFERERLARQRVPCENRSAIPHLWLLHSATIPPLVSKSNAPTGRLDREAARPGNQSDVSFDSPSRRLRRQAKLSSATPARRSGGCTLHFPQKGQRTSLAVENAKSEVPTQHALNVTTTPALTMCGTQGTSRLQRHSSLDDAHCDRYGERNSDHPEPEQQR